MRLLFALAFLAAAPACAQTETPAEALDPQDHTTLVETDAAPEASGDDAAGALSPAEQAVQATIEGEGIHVVHFWAPWCGNSMNELKSGLYEAIEAHPDVTFSFVTIRNGDEDGAETLARYAIPERVDVLVHPERDGRNVRFLGRDVTWTPTTWIFNREGKLAYAFNYGEVSPAMLTQAIADARNDWHHD